MYVLSRYSQQYIIIHEYGEKYATKTNAEDNMK